MEILYWTNGHLHCSLVGPQFSKRFVLHQHEVELLVAQLTMVDEGTATTTTLRGNWLHLLQLGRLGGLLLLFLLHDQLVILEQDRFDARIVVLFGLQTHSFDERDRRMRLGATRRATHFLILSHMGASSL